MIAVAKRMFLRLSALCVLSLLCWAYAQANVVLYSTRVVFPSDQPEQTLKLENSGDIPVLVQAWVDAGMVDISANIQKTPFTVIPPLFRLEGHQQQSIKIIYDGTPLPSDRESVYWLSVYEIPPIQNTPNENQLQIALRTRIKLFFRPAELAVSSSQELFRSLSCFNKSTRPSEFQITCENHSPYYISLARIYLKSEDAEQAISIGLMDMLPPFSIETANPITDTKHMFKELGIDIINDQGAAHSFTIKLGDASP